MRLANYCLDLWFVAIFGIFFDDDDADAAADDDADAAADAAADDDDAADDDHGRTPDTITTKNPATGLLSS